MELVEREGALRTLRGCLWRAGERGNLALVAGEAGIGKTSLLRLLAQAHDSVWWGACDALDTPHPLAPLLDIARDQAVRFRGVLDGPRVALFEAVLDELRLAVGPVLVVIEDVHWADEATLDLIKFLGRRIESTRALLVISYRDDEIAPSHPLRRVTGELPATALTRIELERLSPAGVEALARRAFRSPAGLYAATQGNPFFLAELLRHPAEQVPPTVQDLVLARFARLDAQAQSVVRLVAIVPGHMETWLLEKILPAAMLALERCFDSGLLVADGATLGFRHELARVAIESSIAQPVARPLHAQVLRALAASGRAIPAARLAHHAALAGDEKSVRLYAPAAAEEAQQRGAHREAARHLRTALREGEGAGEAERIRWLEGYALISVDIDWHDEAVETRQELDAVYRRSGNIVGEASNLSRLALLHAYVLRNDEANATSRRAIELLESVPAGPALATAYGIEASLRLLDRETAESALWARKSIALARRFDDRRRLCYSLSTLGSALMFHDYGAGCRQLEEALAMAKAQELPMGAANALLDLGCCSAELMHLQAAERWLRQAIACGEEQEFDGSSRYCSAWLSLCELHAGRWAEAAERAGAIAFRPGTMAAARVVALVALGRLRARRGDPGVEEAVDAALALAGPASSLQSIAPVRAARAEAAFARGDAGAAAAEAGAALPLALVRGHPWFIGELAFWCWRAGALDQAPDGCAEPYALQIAGDWRAAAAAWQKLGCPFERARALADGDTQAQREALAIFEELGARPAAEAVRHRLHGAGVRGLARGARRSTRAHAFGLTTRELQVLQLLCEGMRNAQIALRLSRSPRTVDHHLAAVFAKLGVGSRVEAIQSAQRAGLAPQSGQAPPAN